MYSKHPLDRSAHDVDVIAGWLQCADLLSDFHSGRLRALAKYTQYKKLNFGDIILQEGVDRADEALYIVFSGQVTLASNGEAVGTCEPGDTFGIVDIIHSSFHDMTAVATSTYKGNQTEILFITASDFEVASKPFREQTSWDLVNFLSGIPMFRGYPRLRLLRLLGATNHQMYQPGQVMIAQGNPPNELFIICKGRCEEQCDIFEPLNFVLPPSRATDLARRTRGIVKKQY